MPDPVVRTLSHCEGRRLYRQMRGGQVPIVEGYPLGEDVRRRLPAGEFDLVLVDGEWRQLYPKPERTKKAPAE